MFMATITLKNIPNDLYKRLKQMAKANHRSVNSEIIYTLERSLGISQENLQDIRVQLEEFRNRMAERGTLPAAETNDAINQGRA